MSEVHASRNKYRARVVDDIAAVTIWRITRVMSNSNAWRPGSLKTRRRGHGMPLVVLVVLCFNSFTVHPTAMVTDAIPRLASLRLVGAHRNTSKSSRSLRRYVIDTILSVYDQVDCCSFGMQRKITKHHLGHQHT